jgi:hypothetical protein
VLRSGNSKMEAAELLFFHLFMVKFVILAIITILKLSNNNINNNSVSVVKNTRNVPDKTNLTCRGIVVIFF